MCLLVKKAARVSPSCCLRSLIQPLAHLRLLLSSPGTPHSCLSVYLTEVALFVLMCFCCLSSTHSTLLLPPYLHVAFRPPSPILPPFTSLYAVWMCPLCQPPALCFMFSASLGLCPSSCFHDPVTVGSVQFYYLPLAFSGLSLPECYLPNLGSPLSVC